MQLKNCTNAWQIKYLNSTPPGQRINNVFFVFFFRKRGVIRYSTQLIIFSALNKRYYYKNSVSRKIPNDLNISVIVGNSLLPKTLYFIILLKTYRSGLQKLDFSATISIRENAVHQEKTLLVSVKRFTSKICFAAYISWHYLRAPYYRYHTFMKSKPRLKRKSFHSKQTVQPRKCSYLIILKSDQFSTVVPQLMPPCHA